jgi:parallel beta-helix repeat protein
MELSNIWKQRISLSFVVLILCFLFGCGGGGDSSGDSNGDTTTLLSIAMTPYNPSINVGTTQQLTATGTYLGSSTSDITSQVTWSSAVPSVATVDGSGNVTTLAVGSTTITATLEGVSGAIVVTVTSGSGTAALASISVTPANQSISIGNTQQYTATGTYSDSSTSNITSQVTWSSSSLSVATIDASGSAVALAAGSTTITATLNGVSGHTSLAVAAVGTNIHGPIRIHYDEDFTSANGVVSGSGTQADPYIIQGWTINASASDTFSWPYINAGIAVGSTTKYFMVRDCLVDNATNYGCAVSLSSTNNGTIQNCTLSDSGTGILTIGCANIVLSGNTIENCDDGISNGSSSSDGITISGNTITGCTGTGIDFHYLTNSSATGNTVSNNAEGIYISSIWSGGCTISNNTVQGNTWDGVYTDDDSTGVTITANNITNNGGTGLGIYGSSNAVTYNTSSGNGGMGIRVDFTSGGYTASSNTIDHNTASGNAWDGIYVGSDCISNTITNNVFTGNNTSGQVNFYYDMNINASPNTLSGNTYGTMYP